MSKSIAAKYSDAVKQAKLLVKQRNKLKYEIAKIALSVCIVQEGNCQSVSLYTLSSFAKDIGIARGTLNRWTLEYKYIVSKIPKGEKVNIHALNRTMEIINKDTSSKEVKRIYDSYTKYDNPEDKTLVDYKKRLASMHFFICYSARLEKLNKTDLEEMRMLSQDIVDCITTMKSKSVIKNTSEIKRAIKMVTK